MKPIRAKVTCRFQTISESAAPAVKCKCRRTRGVVCTSPLAKITPEYQNTVDKLNSFPALQTESDCNPETCPYYTEPRISVVMPHRDEGAEAVLTAESFLAAGADEVLIVDDGSEEKDFLWPLERNPRCKIIILGEVHGPAYCRNLAARKSTGDVIVFSDCHVRVHTGDFRAFAKLAIQYDAIMCAAVRPLRETETDRDWIKYGGRLVLDESKLNSSYAIKYNGQRPRHVLTKVDALIGSVYAISRKNFDHLGGWVSTQTWGYNEQALSLKAFFAGMDIIVHRDFAIAHRFRKQFPYAVHKSRIDANRFIVHGILFDPDTFENHWLPKLQQAFPRSVDVAQEYLASDWLAQERERFRKIKIKTDEEFFAWSQS